MTQDFKELKVTSKNEIKLSKIDTEAKDFDITKEEALVIFEKNIEKLKELQEKLYAEHKQSILIVLQAIDGGGKDGTIEHVFGPLNSQGCRIASFKVPTPIEADHDFLWRIHAQTPAKGEITVFNRSHYEQVLVVRVHDLEPKVINKTRYDQINDFEKLLASNNTHILKFFLHISKDEQLQRFKDRIDDPSKHWKVAAGDFAERQKWDDYMAAFEDMVNKCSKDNAPWFVIPADKKWFRDLAISQILVDYMDGMNIQLPQTDEDIEAIKKLYDAEVSKEKK